MKLLVDTLEVRLPPGSVHLNSAVDQLKCEPGSRCWRLRVRDGTWIDADAVCLALAAHQSARLLENLDSSLAEKLRSIRYASTITVNLAYRCQDIPRPLDGFGFVVPAIEKRQILACTFCHVKFAGRAPQHHALLRAFMGGALQPEVFDLDKNEIIRVVRQNLRELLGISAEPIFCQIERHPQSMAQYRVGHLELVAEIDSRVQNLPALQLAGNAFTGVGIPDCIHRGEECADRILAELRKNSAPGGCA